MVNYFLQYLKLYVSIINDINIFRKIIYWPQRDVPYLNIGYQKGMPNGQWLQLLQYLNLNVSKKIYKYIYI